MSLDEADVAALSLHPVLPPEIIVQILEHVYYSILPTSSSFPNPDPHLTLLDADTRSPHFAQPPAQEVIETFRPLTLVDRTWGREAQRWLWFSISFTMPRSFESVLRTIDEYKGGHTLEKSQRDLGQAGLASKRSDSVGRGSSMEEERGRGRTAAPFGVEEDKWGKMSGSGRRDGAMLDDPAIPDLPPAIAPEPSLNLEPADSPFLHTRVLSFSQFRTAGMGRSVRQNSHERFVTPHRLVSLLRGTRAAGSLMLPGSDLEEGDACTIENVGRMEAVGLSEFMDSAISRDVLEELLFRGGYLAEYDQAATFGHDASHVQLAGKKGKEREREDTVEDFVAKQLQSSLSRSRSPIKVVRIIEEDSAEEDAEMGDANSDDDIVAPSQSPERPRGRRPLLPRLERRASGSAYRPLASPSGSATREESEERGRSRPRPPRSLLPPSALSTRSTSVPAFLAVRPLSRSVSLTSRPHRSHHERASSVPAVAVRGKDRSVASRIVARVLEGSVKVRAIRALDLCGCVSTSFIAALADLISTYHLGPPGFFEGATNAITAITEVEDANDGEESDSAMSEDSTPEVPDRKLRRIYFPYLRRLGLAQALIPSPHLTSLVLSFPFLTHLDLTATLASPLLLFGLASAGKTGLGGRKMRLHALSLARCRLIGGDALVGLLCGDCPPFTSMSGYGTGDDKHDESWGRGEIVSELVDLSLYGDATSPSPLSMPELRLILTISPAFLSGRLRTLDLSSAPLTDAFLADHFPPQPNLIELGLANCRNISVQGVATLLLDKCPSVEVLDLSSSCPAPRLTVASAQRRAALPPTTISVMQLHAVLLGQVASTQPSSSDPKEAQAAVQMRKTNLRVVELDEKSLEAVQGGAGDWKPVWGKGRRGWYVDLSVASRRSLDPGTVRPRELYHLPKDSNRRRGLQRLASLNGVVSGDIGWHSRKMEVLRGDGLMGRENGLYVFHAYQV